MHLTPSLMHAHQLQAAVYCRGLWLCGVQLAAQTCRAAAAVCMMLG